MPIKTNIKQAPVHLYWRPQYCK